MSISGQSPKGARTELYVRTVSGVAMIAVALACLWIGGWAFGLLVLLAAALMGTEWFRLTRSRSLLFRLAGVPYVLLPTWALFFARSQPEYGFGLTLWTLAIVWATDIGAYFAGRAIGGPKLAPALSPSKTWAGLIGGMVLAGLTAWGAAQAGGLPPLAAWLGAPLAVLAQAGDLFESGMKRRAGVKDSGAILPGHGGALDRLDGVVPVATVVGLLLWCGLL